MGWLTFYFCCSFKALFEEREALFSGIYIGGCYCVVDLRSSGGLYCVRDLWSGFGAKGLVLTLSDKPLILESSLSTDFRSSNSFLCFTSIDDADESFLFEIVFSGCIVLLRRCADLSVAS